MATRPDPPTGPSPKGRGVITEIHHRYGDKAKTECIGTNLIVQPYILH